MSKLYLMLGYPGAGKTTTAELIAKATGAVHISSDRMRIALFPSPSFTPDEHKLLYQELDKLTEDLLRAGKDVIYDANLNRFKHRQDKYEMCTKTNTKSVLIWVKTETELAKKRAVHDSRSHLWPPDEPADKMFDRLAEVFEPPSENEPYIELNGSSVTPESVNQILGNENKA